MNYIKLDATTSTNDYLKGLMNQQILENFTVISAEKQTHGKGQRGSQWVSDEGKNLIMSILIKDVLLTVTQIYVLNISVSLAILDVFKSLKIPKVSVKWPNDIMSGDFKIGGILIENSLKSNGEINSIVGIGLNINQNEFSNLNKASSLLLQMKIKYDKEEILFKIVEHIKRNCQKIIQNQEEELWSEYHKNIFKKGIPMPFEDENKNKFMGIIQNVTPDGKIELLLEDETIKQFNIKELKMLY